MSDQSKFEQQIRSRIGQHAVKDFGLKVMFRSVILTGTVGSFYHKQILNVIALDMFPKHVVSNNVEVL